MKRTVKTVYMLQSGPFAGQKIRLSKSGKNTLIFSVKGQTGRYIKANDMNALIWEDQ
jgi:hypothetical protein